MSRAVPGYPAATFEGDLRRAKIPSKIDKYTFLHK